MAVAPSHSPHHTGSATGTYPPGCTRSMEFPLTHGSATGGSGTRSTAHVASGHRHHSGSRAIPGCQHGASMGVASFACPRDVTYGCLRLRSPGGTPYPPDRGTLAFSSARAIRTDSGRTCSRNARIQPFRYWRGDPPGTISPGNPASAGANHRTGSMDRPPSCSPLGSRRGRGHCSVSPSRTMGNPPVGTLATGASDTTARSTGQPCARAHPMYVIGRCVDALWWRSPGSHTTASARIRPVSRTRTISTATCPLARYTSMGTYDSAAFCLAERMAPCRSYIGMAATGRQGYGVACAARHGPMDGPVGESPIGMDTPRVGTTQGDSRCDSRVVPKEYTDTAAHTGAWRMDAIGMDTARGRPCHTARRVCRTASVDTPSDGGMGPPHDHPSRYPGGTKGGQTTLAGRMDGSVLARAPATVSRGPD